jgi:hypothetical protein
MTIAISIFVIVSGIFLLMVKSGRMYGDRLRLELELDFAKRTNKEGENIV